MKPQQQCPDCGTPIPEHQPRGLCSFCALDSLLQGDSPSATQPMPPDGGILAPKPTAHHAGKRFGDYELLEEIARGGMGAVYKARQVSLDRSVALKFLLSGEFAGQEAIERFLNEAATAAGLQHPSIVAIHEVGKHDGQHFFAMDLIEGPSLAKLLRDGPLPAKRAAAYLRTIAEAVHFAHTRRVLHRDLKPSNVLINQDDRPLVTDFGLAKNLESDSGLTVTGHVYGSPSFMSPEQASGHREGVCVQSDVYSLGAILYHAITGRPPIVGQTMAETLRMVESVEPIMPRLLNTSIPRDLETICLKCLRKESGRRYSSAAELAAELGRFLRNEPIHAHPVGSLERLWRWGKRNPLAASFFGTICAALAISLWLLYLVNLEKNKQVVLVQQVKESDRANNVLLRRTLGMISENLDGIWANRDRRLIELTSDEIAALAQLPILPATSKMPLVRWRMGVVAEDNPAARVRHYAKLLSELESSTSRSLGLQVRVDLRVYKFAEDFTADLRSRRVDFGRMAALPFLRVRRSHPDLIPLVIPTANYKPSLLFTSTNTLIRSLREIHGRSVAFGDTNATVSYWAQIMLTENGITATNLSSYDFLDSTLEFAEDVQELGYTNALSRIGYLHSHAQVIENVIAGHYDVGVARRKAFQIHEHRGLVAIPGSDFESSRNVMVARPGFDPAHAKAIISAMTSLKGHWLESLPDRSMGYQEVGPTAFASEERWLDRVATAFPSKPSPPRISVPEAPRPNR